MNTATDQIYVKSHVARDLLQSAGLFKTDKLVVWEYVSNGLQYANAGTNPVVRVTLDSKKKRIVIADNGRGMDWAGLQNFFVMHGENIDRKEGRPGRGRFGTGKSAAFGIAADLRIITARSRGFLDRIGQVARGAIRHCGVATVDDVAVAAGTAVSLTQKLLPIFPGFRWLDEFAGWFWIANTPQNSLLTQIRKILAASPCVDVGELRAGVGRHHRRKGFAPPRRVLLELCRQLPWCQVEDTTVAASESLDADQILSESEQIIVKVFKEHGAVLQKSKFEQLCVHAGMNPHSFSILLSYSPIVCRHAAGVYGLRGAEVPLGLVESLIPKRTSRSKLLLDYAWTNERNIQIIYKVSHGTLSNGIVSVPAALKAFLQGRFTLVAGDNSRIGTLVVKDGSAWGLGPFFSRRGGEPGDYLSIVFDLSRRCALVQIGDEDSIEQLRSAPSERYSTDENVDEASITPTLPGRADLLLLEEPIRLCRMNEEWSDDEVRRTVIAYFDMLADELSKRPYNKAERRRLLIEHLRNRSHGAVERKHQNISAILDEMQFPYIDGYKPLRNYQASLKAGVDAYLSEHPKFFTKK
jgi:hypothetical protein